MRQLWISIPLISAILTGCSTPAAKIVPPADQLLSSETQANRLSEASQSVAPDNPWWIKLQDPLLDRLVKQAIAANPDLLSAYSAIKEARAYHLKTDASRLPEVSLNGGYNYRYDNASEQNTDTFSASLDAQWELDLFERNLNTTKAAMESYLATEASYTDALISLSAEVANTYIELINQQAQLKYLKSSLSSWRQTIELMDWQVQAGLETRLALEQAKRSYAQNRASIPSYDATIIELKHTLATLLGVTIDQLPAELNQSDNFPTNPTISLSVLPADIVKQRPDVKAAEHQAQAAAYEIAIAEADLLPALTLSGSLSNTTETLAKLFSLERLITSLSAGLTQNLIDHDQRQQQVYIKQEQALQALLTYKKTVLAALSEIGLSADQITSNQAQLKALKTALDTSQLEERLAQLQYNAGEADFYQVLSAQRTRLELQQQFTNARSQGLKYTINLTKATMGNWAWNYTEKLIATEAKDTSDEPAK